MRCIEVVTYHFQGTSYKTKEEAEIVRDKICYDTYIKYMQILATSGKVNICSTAKSHNETGLYFLVDREGLGGVKGVETRTNQKYLYEGVEYPTLEEALEAVQLSREQLKMDALSIIMNKQDNNLIHFLPQVPQRRRVIGVILDILDASGFLNKLKGEENET